MENEKKEITQPLDFIGKLREAVKPLGFDIFGFGITPDKKIYVELDRPVFTSESTWGEDPHAEMHKKLCPHYEEVMKDYR